MKSFDADVVEALGYKGAIAAADELRGLLEGSKKVNTRKAAPPSEAALFLGLPQSLGAAAECLTAAYGAVRAEVRSAALPPKAGVSPNTPSPLLATTLLDTGKLLDRLFDNLILTQFRSLLHWYPATAVSRRSDPTYRPSHQPPQAFF